MSAFHNLAHDAEIIPILPQFEQKVRLFDTEKIPCVIQVGERTTEEQLLYIKLILALANPAEH